MAVEFEWERSEEPVPSCNAWPDSPELQTFFTSSDLPASVANPDGKTRLVLGTRFSPSVSGKLTGFRFLQAFGESKRGHTGRIYEFETGTLLASIAFTRKDCGRATWLSVPLPEEVDVVADTDYMVAIDNVLSYAKNDRYFKCTKQRGKLRFINGYYGFDFGVMPNEESGTAANYWVDGECSIKCDLLDAIHAEQEDHLGAYIF
jgi:hypothetical protein